jgi:hypothetical protein
MLKISRSRLFVGWLTIKSVSQETWSLDKQWDISKLYASMTDAQPDPCRLVIIVSLIVEKKQSE